MNRRPSGLKLDKAIPGFLQFKSAEGLSPRTLVCSCATRIISSSVNSASCALPGIPSGRTQATQRR